MYLSLPPGFEEHTATNGIRIVRSHSVDPLMLEMLKQEHLTLSELCKAVNDPFHQLYEMAAAMPKSASRTVAAAKRLVTEASLCADREMMEKRAEEALSICPEAAAEAYIILAQLQDDLATKINLLKKGVEASSASFKPNVFANPDGYFWQELESRPYMRCRTALALALREAGAKREAIEHFKELLRLNPYDNQAIRFQLLNAFLDEDVLDAGADQYFTEYESDTSAMVRYACALWRFVRYGRKHKKAQLALKHALESNRFVPALLLGMAKDPGGKLFRVHKTSAQEAIAYSRASRGAWTRVDGAARWLRNSCPIVSAEIKDKIKAAKQEKIDLSFSQPIAVPMAAGATAGY